MVKFSRSWLSSSLLACVLAQQGLSMVFEDAEAPDAFKPLLERGIEPSEDSLFSSFNRLSKESYYWHGSQNGHKTLANLTVDVGDDEANIVSMERFRHLLKSIDCTSHGMEVEFDSSRAFDYTQRGWQWVNDDDDRKLILIAGSKGCGWNAHRTPFIISSIAFDKSSLKAKLTGAKSTWKKLFRNYELNLGNVPESSSSSPERRDWDPSTSLSFNHPIPLNTAINIPGTNVSVDVTCDDCKTTGSFDLGVHIKTEAGIPNAASFTLAPNGVSASFIPKLSLSGNVTQDLSDEHEIIKFPVEGISIPGGVFDLGPQIVLSYGYEIGPVQGSAEVSAGVTLSLADSAGLEIDLLSPDVSAGGWTPRVQTKPMAVNAEIEAGVEIYTKAEVQLEASVLDQGFEAGVNLKPYLGGTISAATKRGLQVGVDVGEDAGVNIASGGTEVCAKPRAGVSLNVDIAYSDEPEDPIVEQTIADVQAPIPSKCYTVGPSGAVKIGDETPTPSSSSIAHSSTPAGSSSSAQPSKSSSKASSSSATPTSSHAHPSSSASGSSSSKEASGSSTAHASPSESTPPSSHTSDPIIHSTTTSTTSYSTSYSTSVTTSIHHHARYHRRHHGIGRR